MGAVEDTPKLSLKALRESPGWEQLRANLGGWVVLQDRDGRTFRAEVRQTTDRNNRGTRHWFLCACGARRRHLYIRDGRLACRRCLGLHYHEQLLPDSRWRSEVGRPVLRAWRTLKCQ